MQASSSQSCPVPGSFSPDIKNELKKKDDEFVKTLKRQAEDIDTLLQYMSRQFVEMQNAYKEELEEIENAFLQVRAVYQGAGQPPANRMGSLITRCVRVHLTKWPRLGCVRTCRPCLLSSCSNPPLLRCHLLINS